jgi:hypothetical protein
VVLHVPVADEELGELELQPVNWSNAVKVNAAVKKKLDR